jgi:signal transduction histidine kinase
LKTQWKIRLVPIKNEATIKLSKEIAWLLSRNRLAFIVILFLVISTYFINAYKDSLFKITAQWLVHTVSVKDMISTVQSQQKEIGLTVRGFIVSGDSTYLARYNNTFYQLGKNIDSLKKLTSDNDEQQRKVGLLRRYFQQDALLSNNLIIISSLESGNKAYSPLLRSELSISDSITEVCRLMSANENALLKSREQIFQSTSLQSSIFSALRFLLTILIIILSYGMLTQELNRRKKTEQQLLIYEKQLQQKITELNRSNEELEQFAFVASHDMQEPLRKVIAFSDRLKIKYQNSLDETGQLYLDKIQSASARMSKLIKDLLEFSRVGNTPKTDFTADLNLIIGEIAQDLETSILQKKATIEWKSLPTINADSAQVYRLFSNLIVNAIKFSKHNVAAKIKIQSQEVTGEEIGHDKENIYYKISVTDNGIGFDEVNRDRIFTIFKRLHGRSEYEGSGIGLAICKRIVFNYGGAIKAFSKINEGSVFSVYMPK